MILYVGTDDNPVEARKPAKYIVVKSSSTPQKACNTTPVNSLYRVHSLSFCLSVLKACGVALQWSVGFYTRHPPFLKLLTSLRLARSPAPLALCSPRYYRYNYYIIDTVSIVVWFNMQYLGKTDSCYGVLSTVLYGMVWCGMME